MKKTMLNEQLLGAIDAAKRTGDYAPLLNVVKAIEREAYFDGICDALDGLGDQIPDTMAERKRLWNESNTKNGRLYVIDR